MLEGRGWLGFRSKGNDVLIYSSEIERAVRVPFEQILAEWKLFGRRVYMKVVERQPEMKEFFRLTGIVDPYEFKYRWSSDQSFSAGMDSSWFEEDDETYADFG